MATVQQLVEFLQRVNVECEPDGAWGAYLLPAVMALPPGDYRLVDPETDYDQLGALGLGDSYAITEAVQVVSTKQLAEWHGGAGDMGYGDLQQQVTANGTGLVFAFGGSPANSAFVVYVYPAADLPAAYPDLGALQSSTLVA